jgi:hypothetical protein
MGTYASTLQQGFQRVLTVLFFTAISLALPPALFSQSYFGTVSGELTYAS